MKRFLCCLGGGSSSNVVQETAQPPRLPQPTGSSVRFDDENDKVNDEEPLENNEFLNNARRDNIELPEDREFPDSSSNPHSSSPPLHAHTGGSFLWQEIVEGTQNFRLTHFLGQGNFGKVYRCNLPRIHKVGAAKIQDRYNPLLGSPELVTEITSLHEANHPNVIKLIGKCFSFKNSAMVYEFMPMGSLDYHLFTYAKKPGPGLLKETRVLDWDKRMRIAVGVAEALVYLHDELKMIHLDVKVSNILLDEDFVPKLSDFGLATEMDEDEDGTEIQRKIFNPVKETWGCIAPETKELGLVSTKSDVFSYGVFLFQLFTGREVYDLKRPLETKNITDCLMPDWSREEYSLVVDVALGNKFSVEALGRLLFTARMCIDPEAFSRPDMGFVETMVRQAAAFPVPESSPVIERHSL